MRRKTIILGLCFLGLLILQAQAASPKTAFVYDSIKGIPHGYEEIELRGLLATMVGPNAIEAGANDNDIYIGFNESFGNVNISIYNAMGGLVYSTVVNTDMQQTIIIPFANVLSGSYTVEVSNANGSVEGDFHKD